MRTKLRRPRGISSWTMAHEVTVAIVGDDPVGRFIVFAWITGLRFELTGATWPA
jgi:hypothetical protein